MWALVEPGSARGLPSDRVHTQAKRAPSYGKQMLAAQPTVRLTLYFGERTNPSC